MTQYAVIFDMDGVIVDTNPYHDIAFQKFFDKHQIQFSKQDFEDHLYGKFNSYIMKYFFKNPDFTDQELKDLEDEKEAMFREVYAGHVKSLPGFLPFLKALKAENFLTGVATSAPIENLNFIKNELGFGPLMNSLMSSEDVVHHKPNPEVYLKTMDKLGVEPSQTLIFEDSVSGATAGKSAGAKVVGVLTTHSREQLAMCDYFINDFTDISVEKVKEIIARN